MNDYYPFGMLVPTRNYASPEYRYGFNGKEKDDEVKGFGAQYDYGFRIYDPRLGKFLSRDPLSSTFPWYTPYQFAGNKPIWKIDLDGLEEVDVKLHNFKETLGIVFAEIEVAVGIDGDGGLDGPSVAFNTQIGFAGDKWGVVFYTSMTGYINGDGNRELAADFGADLGVHFVNAKNGREAIEKFASGVAVNMGPIDVTFSKGGGIGINEGPSFGGGIKSFSAEIFTMSISGDDLGQSYHLFGDEYLVINDPVVELARYKYKDKYAVYNVGKIQESFDSNGKLIGYEGVLQIIYTDENNKFSTVEYKNIKMEGDLKTEGKGRKGNWSSKRYKQAFDCNCVPKKESNHSEKTEIKN